MRLLLMLLLSLLFPISAIAATYQGTCSIQFQGTSTLHDFDGQGRCEPFTAQEREGVLSVPELKVAVAGMDTDNTKRDKKMREMFDSATYPMITGQVDPLSLAEIRSLLHSGGQDVPIEFNLKIRDIEKPVRAVLKEVTEMDSQLGATLVFPLSLAAYDLKPPSVLGLIRVGDTVTVITSFSLQRQ